VTQAVPETARDRLGVTEGDADNHVIEGVVADVPVPVGIVTRLSVDRTAKGNAVSADIYFIQSNYVTPSDYDYNKSGNAVLMVDDVQPPLFTGDRAVLFLIDITGALGDRQQRFIQQRLGDVRMYMIARGAGQYRMENGKARAEKASEWMPHPERRFEGKSEGDILAAAEERAHQQAATTCGGC